MDTTSFVMIAPLALTIAGSFFALRERFNLALSFLAISNIMLWAIIALPK